MPETDLTQSGVQLISLPDGRVLTRENFYGERDSRTTQVAVIPTSRYLVGIVLPEALTESVGAQTGLIWLASMLRRMGQALSDTVIIGAAFAASAPYNGRLRTDRDAKTLEEALDAELSGADPFGSITWRDLKTSDPFAGLHLVVSIGDPNLKHRIASGTKRIVMNADGWVASVDYAEGDLANIESSRRCGMFDAAIPAIVTAAAFAAGIAYRALRSESATPLADIIGGPVNYWYSIDSGAVTTDPTEGQSWREHGSAQRDKPPWNEADGDPVRLPDEILFVSAGGIGNNIAQILAGSHVLPTRTVIMDPDLVDVSNLNRLVGVSVDDVTKPKALTAGFPLVGAGFSVEAVVIAYEEWTSVMRQTGQRVSAQAALVGVDQLISRLNVQADWPSLLINGGTSGTGWGVSSHPRGCGGCLGCTLAGVSQTYADTRRAVGCAVGVNLAVPGAVVPPDPSYPFSSVSAAASMVALLINHSGDSHTHGTKRALNAVSPQFAVVSKPMRHPLCLLLCSDPGLGDFFPNRCEPA